MFDEWGKISISDENARLDNLAVFLQKEQPTWVVYLMFYDSTRVCAGELNARATRAKKWLVTPSRVILVGPDLKNFHSS